MYWEAGQARVARDEKQHLAELFITVRDGSIAALAATGQLKPGWQPPAYLERERTPEQRAVAAAAGLAALARDYPGNVHRIERDN
jgi:hypothetical protein